MIDLKEFRKANNLLQKDVADYIGVSRGYIAMVESGKTSLPIKQLRKLLNNTLGWDISMLEGEMETENTGSRNDSQSLLAKENEMLRQQIAELKEQNEKYWEMIQRLTAR